MLIITREPTLLIKENKVERVFLVKAQIHPLLAPRLVRLRFRSLALGSLLRLLLGLFPALSARPIVIWNLIEAYAVQVVRPIARITQQRLVWMLI